MKLTAILLCLITLSTAAMASDLNLQSMLGPYLTTEGVQVNLMLLPDFSGPGGLFVGPNSDQDVVLSKNMDQFKKFINDKDGNYPGFFSSHKISRETCPTDGFSDGHLCKTFKFESDKHSLIYNECWSNIVVDMDAQIFKTIESGCGVLDTKIDLTKKLN